MSTSLPIYQLLILVLCSFTTTTISAQQGELGVPEAVHYAKDEYKAGRQNWCMVQDQQGLMWFGNNKGILTFDGSMWSLQSLPNRTVVRSLAKDKDGTIWVGGQDEFGYLKVNEIGERVYHSLQYLVPEDAQNLEDVWKVFPDGERVYFCTQRGLLIYKAGEITSILPKQRFVNFFFVNGSLYAQERGIGLMHLHGDNFELVDDRAIFRFDRIAEILPRGDHLMIITESNGLYLLQDGEVSNWSTPSSDFLRTANPYCAIFLPEKQSFAIGTTKDGLLLMDKDGVPQQHYNRTSGLQNNTILSIHQDSFNNLWLGLDNGIDYLKIGAPFSILQEFSGVAGTGYQAAYHDGRLFLGTNQGVFTMDWPVIAKPLSSINQAQRTGLRSQLWSFNVLDDKLIACTNDGAFLWQNGRFVDLSPNRGSWRFLSLLNQPDHLLEGGYQGLYLYQRNGDGWEYQRKLVGFEESARVMEQDEHGYIWVSHAYKGLFRIRLDEQFNINEVRFFGAEDGLPADIGINVAKIQGVVFFTTPAGAYRYDAESDQLIPFERFNESLGSQQPIKRLLGDGEERIWFSLDEKFGFIAVQKGTLFKDKRINLHVFNQLRGKLVDGFEHIATIDENNILIATENGFVTFHALKAEQRKQDLQVLIREVYTHNGKDSLVYANANPKAEKDEILIDFDAHLKAIRFVYAAPFFESLDQLQYRYRLSGYQKEWSSWGRRTEKEFSNLPHGDYLFEVQAMNAYGDESEVAAFPFYISPPWYASKTAKIVSGFLVLGLMIGFLVYNHQRIEKERANLAEEQARELAQQEAQFKEEQERSEEEIIRLRDENLQADVKHKTSQLAAATMHLVQKGEVLLKIKKELEKLKKSAHEDHKRRLQQLVHTIDANIRLDSNWEQFEAYFDQVHENFLKNLRQTFPDLTPKDQKMCAYLRMNLTTKEIAPLMNISVRGVEISRYRLRKKMGLDTQTNLTDFIMRF